MKVPTRIKHLLDNVFKHLGYQRIPQPVPYKVEARAFTLLKSTRSIPKSRLVNHPDALEFAERLKRYTRVEMKDEVLKEVAKHLVFHGYESSDGSEIIFEACLVVNTMTSNINDNRQKSDLRIWME